MSVLANYLNRGLNQPTGKTGQARLSSMLGRWLATRGKDVRIGEKTDVSPSALINPRQSSIRIGRSCIVSPHAQIQGNVEIGDSSSVQSFTIIVGYEGGKVKIGSGVRIAGHCMLIAGNHVFKDPEAPIHTQGIEPAPITVGDDVWIAGKVSITAGVTIGKGSVIGAGAVVTRDIPPMSVAIGMPAEVKKRRV